MTTAQIKRNGRYAVFDRRVAAVEATLARIEDCLTAEKPLMGKLVPERKSLGWVNTMRLADGRLIVEDSFSPTREHADICARMFHGATRLACVEIFEGDGL